MTGSDRQIAVSPMDVEHLARVRENVNRFMRHVAGAYAAGGPARLLDIAPQDHAGARPFFDPAVAVETFDINPAAGTTYVGDLCRTNACLAAGAFDFVVCTEVLEHTLQPFDAVRELWRVLRPGGLLFLTVPFNLRIHGPLPDCWRFTEHGLRAILRDWELLELDAVETPGRPLMPIHYAVVARKPR